MSEQIRILSIFKDQFITFIDELIAQFPREPDLVIVRIFMKDQVPVADVLSHMIKEILPHEQRILNKEESFFLDNTQLFSQLGSKTVIHFKRLWTSPALDFDDRDAIWDWFKSFCSLAKSYQKTLVEKAGEH
jgi:hypothetical protein|tara:strand:+ start:2410 stop:2805 length:396 start_codon:yes stop_codon:yes gene_type:complete